jgi:hypothetical protein
MVMDPNTANGAATFSRIQKAISGTATNASPKPSAERINAAMNNMNRTSRVVAWIAFSLAKRI